MRPRIATLSALAVAMAALWALPAGAATRAIAIRDNYFDPSSVSATMGTTFTWTNQGAAEHTATYKGALHLWDSGTLEPAGTLSRGQSFRVALAWAGTYPYYCTIHGFTGRLSIPDGVSPSAGSSSTVFTIALGTTGAGAGRVFDVQRRKGTGSWVTITSGTTSRRVTFKAGSLGRGTYSFRSRLRKAGRTAATGWSPARSVRVS
jgi:plastocyanin